MAKRGAPLAVLDDATPLTGPRLDVGLRTGWVLRVARLTARPAGRLDRLSDMVTALHEVGVETSVASLHRLETGQLRDGRLIDGYERVLEQPYGSLRAPIDAFCRTFPYGPGDQHPGTAVASVAEMDALFTPLLEGAPTGSDWLRWARAVAQPNALGMPLTFARPLVAQLTSEMGRAFGPGYMARYEALSLLRRSGYGGVVLDVARAVLADPHPQVIFDLMSAVGEGGGQDVDGWLVSLLRDDRDLVVAGAVIGLENLAATSGGASVWRSTVAEVVAAYNSKPTGSEGWRWLSHLVRLLPPFSRAVVETRLAHPLAASPTATAWTRTRLNEHWSRCESLAGRVTDRLGLPEQPILTRLLFEIAMGEEETRAVTGCMLLTALPVVVTEVSHQLAVLAGEHPDPVVRGRASRRLGGMLMGEVPDPVPSWWNQPGELQPVGLKMAGTAGVAVDPAVLTQALRGPVELRRAALYNAGMTQHPLLATICDDATADPDLRGAARWWLDQGGRVPA